MIDYITYKKETLAIIIKSTYLKKKGINFFTNKKLTQQVAFMSHPKNYTISPHFHRKIERKISTTTEVLIIINGILKVNFYSKSKKYLFSKLAKKNEIIILLTGGHGFKIIKSCKFIEVKQGPYNIKKDKIRF
jgi:hypothetical protein